MLRQLLQYIKDVRVEMAKVTWPTRQEVLAGTMLVSVLSVVVSIFVKLFDVALSKILGLVLKL